MVVSDGVMRGRVAHGVMWRRHRGTWRPKAQAQKQPSSRVTPSTSSLTFLVNLAIQRRPITLVTRSRGVVASFGCQPRRWLDSRVGIADTSTTIDVGADAGGRLSLRFDGTRQAPSASQFCLWHKPQRRCTTNETYAFRCYSLGTSPLAPSWVADS